MPAESISKACVRSALRTRLRSTPTARGERQVLPMHTNRTPVVMAELLQIIWGNGKAPVPPRLVPLAGLWPQDLALDLARRRRRPLDDARPVHRPRQGHGTGVHGLHDHRGFLDGALHLPG